MAKLADLPDQVIERAQVILDAFEEKDAPHPQISHLPSQKESVVKEPETEALQHEKEPESEQFQQGTFDLFETPPAESEIEAELKKINISNMTPLQALNKLSELQNQLK